MASEEPLIGRETTEPIPSDKIVRMTSERSDHAEVGGRAIVQRLAQCGRCGRTGWILYDTVNYRAYQCNSCGSCNPF